MTAKPRAVFRFDASPLIGAGHAMRSGALAGALAEAGWRTVCATREETIETAPRSLERHSTMFSGSVRTSRARLPRSRQGWHARAKRWFSITTDATGISTAPAAASHPASTVIEDRPEAAP